MKKLFAILMLTIITATAVQSCTQSSNEDENNPAFYRAEDSGKDEEPDRQAEESGKDEEPDKGAV